MHTVRDIHRSRGGGRRGSCLLLFAVVAAVAVLRQPSAHAYSGSEHMRFPDQAYQIMNIIRHGGGSFYGVQAGQPALTDCPASICTPAACPGGCAGGSTCAACTQWNRFITQVIGAPPKLDNVTVDLPDATLKAPDCAGVLPVLPQGQHLASCRAGELPFPVRRGWGDNANECFLRPGYLSGGADQLAPKEDRIRPFFQELPSKYTGALLGKWATGPDDEFHDTALWFRPTNILIFSEIKGLAQEAVDIALTIILAPVFCVAELIFGGDDCIDDAGSFSHQVDPVTLADEYVGIIELGIFGNATITSDDAPLKGRFILQGLFHFASVSRDGQFNKIPGYKGVDADLGNSGGPPGWSPLDFALIALCDFFGLTIHPDKSTGVVNYSPYADGDFRAIGDWIDPTMGHAEFEPVDNLARWGWDIFRTHAVGAKGLGWVLHAIGDSSQPHHTAAVLGYGHAPWERFALLAWKQNFVEDNIVQHYPQLATALAYGFHWWKFMDDLQTARRTTDLPVGEMIEALAQETFALPVTRFGHAFQQVNFLDTPNPDDSDIISAYDGERAAMRDLMERAIGASIGFLAKASDFVATGGTSPCTCPQGSARLGQTRAGDFIPARDGLCHACGTDVFQQLPNWDDGECVAVCPPDKPTAQGGICTTAGACPAAAPFLENGVCAAHCATNEVVVNNRTCARRCPGNTTEDAAHFCNPDPPDKSPAVCGPINGDGVSNCCSKDGGLCVADIDCCSHNCRNDGICRTVTGGSCVINNDCLSNDCGEGTCQRGHPNQPCAHGTDCLSQRCVQNKCPTGAPGTSCTANGDCASGVCGSAGVCIGRSGESCGAQNSLCVSKLCVNGVCTGDNGDPCSSGAQCGSGNCVLGTCKGQNGDFCSDDSGCLSGSCDTRTLPGKCVFGGPG